ncbi:MAG: hypothetical protein MUE76_06600 [Syntrophales bacterium]|nr:hypothetical protein [Syntrophales bacterium]
MAITFDGANKRIILSAGSTSLDARDCYSRWKDWVLESDNSKYEQAFTVVGGDPIGGGNFVSSYYFLTNGWRVRPCEASHTLTINGSIVVDGGGNAIVPTLGTYQVLVVQSVPVKAETVSSDGGGSSFTLDQIRDAVWAKLLEGALSADAVMRVMLAALSGETAGIGTLAEQYKSLDGGKTRIAVNFDEHGNRTAVSLDGT